MIRDCLNGFIFNGFLWRIFGMKKNVLLFDILQTDDEIFDC